MKVPAARALPAGVSQVDEVALKTWLHGRSHNTASAYRADALRFLEFTGRPLAEVTLSDLQAWDADMTAAGHAEASRARRLTVVRGLLKHAHSVGIIPANPAHLLKVGKPRSMAAERIVSEADVMRMIGVETVPRLRALLRLLYVCGLRASEACDLCWRSLSPLRKGGGEARVLGKGNKERTVVLPPDLWRELQALTPHAAPTAPVIPGQNGAKLNRRAVHRAIKRAVRRAKLDPAISAHWMRHSHASHSLDNGCAPHVLQQSMGHASLATTTKYLHVKPGEGSAAFIKG